MKMRTILVMGFSAVMIAGNAFGGAQEAKNIADAAKRGEAVVSSIVSRTGGSTGGQVSGEETDSGVITEPIWDRLEENDALALPILIQSASTLYQAGSLADQAYFAYLSGNISLGNYKFTMACVKIGLSRSALSRANFAAVQPPVGFLAAFSPDILSVLSEIQLARATNGCF